MNYDLARAQSELEKEIIWHEKQGLVLDESKMAVIYAKALINQQIYANGEIAFCKDNEFYVSKNPAGYAITGYYIIQNRNATILKKPFNITVCNMNGQWCPAQTYVAADTKSCSGQIALWFLISVGCTLMGILMYYIISAAIGI